VPATDEVMSAESAAGGFQPIEERAKVTPFARGAESAAGDFLQLNKGR
jgi:hypothetical protein